MTEEERFDVARRTREMIDRVERFLSGDGSRQDLLAWVQTLGHDSFRGNPCADSLYTNVCNLDDERIRPIDLADCLCAVRHGKTPADDDDFACVTLSIAEISRRTSRPATRFFVTGLGLAEAVQFASLGTGRAFLAGTFLEGAHGAGVRTDKYPSDSALQRDVLADLFDTLTIDAADTLSFRGPTPPIWHLMRRDDNASTALVASFSGYAKARTALEGFEAKLHKQTYWLQMAHP
jgi:hypothetical protein